MAVEYPPLFERTDVAGVKVVADTVFESPLSKKVGRFIPVHGIRVLTLEDGTERLACRDCEVVADAEDDAGGLTPLGQIRAHRKAEHGVALGGARRKHQSAAEAAAAGDVAVPVVLPLDATSMTLHEILELAGHIDEWEGVLSAQDEKIEYLVAERNDLRIRLRAAERENAALKKRIAKALGMEVVITEPWPARRRVEEEQ